MYLDYSQGANRCWSKKVIWSFTSKYAETDFKSEMGRTIIFTWAFELNMLLNSEMCIYCMGEEHNTFKLHIHSSVEW